MKKEYINPSLRFFNVKTNDIIITSDIGIGDDVSEGSTEAPRRSDAWTEYNQFS